jgi:hypothetical protein
MSYIKQKLMFIGLSLSALAAAQSPTTENIPAENWTEENRASLQGDGVTRAKKLIFKVERAGNVAYIRLPKAPTALQRGMWVFEVSKEGQNSFANWDKKKAAWKITLTERGNYTVYVSKRKNNTETTAHSWFVLSF